MGRVLARIEKAGIPTFSLTGAGRAGTVSEAFHAMGFCQDAPQHEFPTEMLLPGSDLTPLSEGVDTIVHGLTKWKPELGGEESPVRSAVEIEGKDYLEAIARFNSTVLRNRWGDGLPVLPPTEECVDRLLTGIDLSRDTPLAVILPKGRVATVESLAVNLAMTGGRPEYMPVLVAAVQGLADPMMRPQMMQHEGSVTPVVVVNGPIGREMRLNSGYSCLGPDAAHPAGGAIGRAIRLVQLNVGGAVPGSGNMSIFAGPSAYTNYVFAEDEEGIPEGWQTLGSERGFPAASNVVTVYTVASSVQVNSPKVTTPEVALPSLDRFARIMSGDYGNYFSSANDEKAPGIVLMPRGIARGLSSLGWSKEEVKAYLWEKSKIPWSVVKGDYYFEAHIAPYGSDGRTRKWPVVAEGESLPIAAAPGNIMMVVAGGQQSQHGWWMRVACCPYAPVSVEVKRPANWNALLKKAEEDLGPLPAP